MIWILVSVAGAGIIYTAFPLVYTLDGARKHGIPIPRGVLYNGYVWLVLGPIGNLIHNVFIATIIFRDLPRELATSGRIQRYVDEGSGWRHDKVMADWVPFMNYCDPGHIKVPE